MGKSREKWASSYTKKLMNIPGDSLDLQARYSPQYDSLTQPLSTSGGYEMAGMRPFGNQPSYCRKGYDPRRRTQGLSLKYEDIVKPEMLSAHNWETRLHAPPKRRIYDRLAAGKSRRIDSITRQEKVHGITLPLALPVPLIRGSPFSFNQVSQSFNKRPNFSSSKRGISLIGTPYIPSIKAR